MGEERIIGYIDNGVVIDHIPPGVVWRVASILRIDKNGTGRISLGDGYESRKVGKKGILKIEGRVLTDKELDIIALEAPEATISIIKEGKVLSKRKAIIPERLENLVYCPNSNCITNDKREKENPVVCYKKGRFVCHYCRQDFSMEEARQNIR